MAHIWMEHEGTGNRAELPDLPFWRAQGWEPCDGPPPELDYTKDPPLRDEPPADEPAPTTETPSTTGSFAVRPQADEQGE